MHNTKFNILKTLPHQWCVLVILVSVVTNITFAESSFIILNQIFLLETPQNYAKTLEPKLQSK